MTVRRSYRAEPARLAGQGHNNGPAMDSGVAWRTQCWTRARADLLPRLPIEVVRTRLRRAAEIGLDYKTYATVHASTGRDVVAILFSTNALRVYRADQLLASEKVAKLQAMQDVDRRMLTIAPLAPDLLARLDAAHGDVLDRAVSAPPLLGSWSEMAQALKTARGAGVPADATLLVGDSRLEQDWVAAGRLAGYVDTARFFGAPHDQG